MIAADLLLKPDRRDRRRMRIGLWCGDWVESSERTLCISAP
jgi:hypothetical protein